MSCILHMLPPTLPVVPVIIVSILAVECFMFTLNLPLHEVTLLKISKYYEAKTIP